MPVIVWTKTLVVYIQIDLKESSNLPAGPGVTRVFFSVGRWYFPERHVQGLPLGELTVGSAYKILNGSK